MRAMRPAQDAPAALWRSSQWWSALRLHRLPEAGLGIVDLDQPPPFDPPEAVADGPDEAAVMRDQEAAGVAGIQFGLQRLLPLDVEMVGRLVQQVEIRPGEAQRQHREPCPLPA